jgi:4-hydroxythreonine-4-phosphate dehydrogenase
VGPEIIMKSLARREVYQGLPSAGHRRRSACAMPAASPAWTSRCAPSPIPPRRFRTGEIDCIDLGLIPADLPYGQLSAVAGNAAFHTPPAPWS